MFKVVLGLIHPPIEWVPGEGALSPVEKGPENEADHSPLQKLRIYGALPSLPILLHDAVLKRMDNFAFL
jgi:hypothetical protein